MPSNKTSATKTKTSTSTSKTKTSKKNTANSELDFATAIAQLENTVKKMQQDELDLEKSLQNFAEGVELVKSCQIKLNQAQQKVDILMQDIEKQGKLQAFDAESETAEEDK